MPTKYTITYGDLTKEYIDSNATYGIYYLGVQTWSRGSLSPIKRDLLCNGLVMLGDIAVGVSSHYTVLECVGKIMRHDVEILCEQYTPPITLTITGNGVYSGTTRAAVVVDGTSYTSDATFSLTSGTKITLEVWGTRQLFTSYNGTITVNGSQVYSGQHGTYEVTISSDATVTLSANNRNGTIVLTTNTN